MNTAKVKVLRPMRCMHRVRQEMGCMGPLCTCIVCRMGCMDPSAIIMHGSAALHRAGFGSINAGSREPLTQRTRRCRQR